MTSSARRSNSPSTLRAASWSRQPVEISTTSPLPSRYFAVYVPAVTLIRPGSAAWSPAIGAVRALPLLSFHRANRSPLRTMISAPAGSGFVKVLR
ncbi:MAG TPA: hypothetical protein VNH11_27870 [Pirellulales bacterium]|nr:hypothetical protein [Pirellulales bacterium]